MRASLEFREVAARRLLTYLSAGRQTLNNQRRPIRISGISSVSLVARGDGASGFQTMSAVLTYKAREMRNPTIRPLVVREMSRGISRYGKARGMRRASLASGG